MSEKKKIEIESPEASTEPNLEAEQTVSEVTEETAGQKNNKKKETDPLTELQDKRGSCLEDSKDGRILRGTQHSGAHRRQKQRRTGRRPIARGTR